MNLSPAQRRALEFAARGGTIEALRPGSNRVGEVEYLYSENGVGLFFDGDDVAILLAKGLLVAAERDPIEQDDVIVTHQMIITDAGSAVLSRGE